MAVRTVNQGCKCSSCLEVYREPVSPAEGRAFNARYKWLRYYSLEETVQPLFEPSIAIPVRALFEGEE